MSSFGLHLCVEGAEAYSDHAAISIGFATNSRLDVGVLADGRIVEVAMEPRVKDYDLAGETPAALAERFDVSGWGLVAAYLDGRRVGGLIVARDCPAYNLLEGRSDLAHIVDLRVEPVLRGHGIGRALMGRAESWARERGCCEIRVETQDINVAACRFYSACGFRFMEANPDAYDGLDEIQLIWSKTL